MRGPPLFITRPPYGHGRTWQRDLRRSSTSGRLFRFRCRVLFSDTTMPCEATIPPLQLATDLQLATLVAIADTVRDRPGRYCPRPPLAKLLGCSSACLAQAPGETRPSTSSWTSWRIMTLYLARRKTSRPFVPSASHSALRLSLPTTGI